MHTADDEILIRKAAHQLLAGQRVVALDATGWREDMVVPVGVPGTYIVIGPVSDGGEDRP